MNSIRKTLAAVAVAAFGIGLAPSAGARSTVAWAGAPNPLTAANCFTESYGRVTNSACNSQETWEIALPVDAGGQWKVTVNVTPGSGSISCMALSVDENGVDASNSSNTAATSGSGAQNISLTVPALPGGGSLFLGCFLTQGAAVNTVNWNQ